jgi:hypothetical protein
MNITLSNINWLAIALGTIAYSAFSGIWHKQFAFGKKWEDAMGFSRPENWKETPIYYFVPSISCFTTTLVISFLSSSLNISSLAEALKLGLITGVGFATAVTFTNAVIPTMKKPIIFGAITGSAHAIGITLVTIIIFLFSK